LASTGTSSFFLHPAEGAHGDLGMLGKDDILIAVSNSGETEEIIRMLPYVKRMGIKIIAMTGGLESTLSKNSDEVLDIAVTEEACPMGLAPTASTTATLAMGDALAVALLEAKDFKEEDFAVLHPAGSLGRKLLKVSDLMHKGEEIPRVAPDVIVKDALFMMTEKRLGLTGVFEGTNLVGVITDGDIRRTLEKGESVLSMRAGDIMGAAPKTILDGELAEKAISVMEKFSITALFALDNRGNVTGVVHLHDLLRAGVV
ncbi:MAG: KpsF/GutQ family sugar-phosphate isomerase, partial [Deltaproteobacteria bacterium]|nr:KpsF/GutQ family sugar-phosphate isomerase [Deltaproteobacteria bacterium]